jgi:phosphoglycerate dehydrogenase-like enzyme
MDGIVVALAPLPDAALKPLIAAGFAVLPWRDSIDRAGVVGILTRSTERVDAGLIAQFPNLRAVATTSSGADNLDLPALRARGIAAYATAGANADATADLTMGLLLSLMRRLPEAIASTRAGDWRRAELAGRELRDRRMGIVGIGNVGRAVARRALAFGMTVRATDPYVTAADLPPDLAAAVPLVPLPALIAESDVLSLHAPLTDETRGLIGADRLAALPDGAIVLNCARGGIVDEAALIAGLARGRPAAAGLDVFESEPPPPGSPLLSLPNVVVTPHIGGSTMESTARMARVAVNSLLAGLLGRPDPPSLTHDRPGGPPR